MEIFNGMFCIALPLLTIFVYSRVGGYPHMPGKHQRDLPRYEADAKGAAAGKDAEVRSLCHFAGQNCSGRKKRFRKKRTLEYAVYVFAIFRIKANFRSQPSLVERND